MATRKEFVEAARSYVGVKFRMYGRDRTGLDCVGLLFAAASDVGIKAKDFRDYSRNPEVKKLQDMLEAYTRPVATKHPVHGYVVKLRQLLFPMHVGILAVEKGVVSVINANIKKKYVVEDSWDDWKDLVLELRIPYGMH